MANLTRVGMLSLPGKRYVAAGAGAEETIPDKATNDNPEPEPENGRAMGPRRKTGIGSR